MLILSPALTSPDMTQPADNIDSTTIRHISVTVFHYNDAVHYAADMQTRFTESDDKDTAFISQHNTIMTDSMMRRILQHLMYQNNYT